VTDGEIDVRTDGETDGRYHIARSAYMMSRAKNYAAIPVKL